jgi:hypothetical protein
MKKLQVFDPAMCCSTGVCGPSVDPTLSRFSADLEWLKSKGVEIERFNLAQQVAAFTTNSTVKHALNTSGTRCLPMLLFNGQVVASGGYPERRQLAQMLEVEYEPGPVFKPKNPDLVGISTKGS